ncbi:hypothetical protein [Coraliomargarita akajimensis]|nr:hypothetical protein [Coraliomargarita akajimensis]
MQKASRSQNGGFALVVALSLMAFILLLLLSMTAMVRVESNAAAISKDRLKARMNAQLGAMVALGNLQKLAGPDQRITARSDAVQHPDNAPINGTKHWTGVWSSKSDLNNGYDANVGLDQRKPQWLVSGDVNPYVNGSNQITSPTQGANNTVALLSGGVTRVQDEVHVPKESILGSGNQSTGDFAYWVSDEGVKARVNIAEDSGGVLGNDEIRYRVSAAQTSDAAAVTLEADRGLSDSEDKRRPFAQPISFWKEQNSKVEQVYSADSLPLLFPGAATGGVEVAKEFYHDFSFNSQSLLVDSKHGGLKRDLSTALWGQRPNDMTGQMWDSESNKKGDPGGPKWDQLADYYQKCVTQAGAGQIDFSGTFNYNDEVVMAPVLLRFHMIANVFKQLKPTAPAPTPGVASPVTDYNFQAGMFPMVTLWNPYDTDMNLSQGLTVFTVMNGIYVKDRTANMANYSNEAARLNWANPTEKEAVVVLIVPRHNATANQASVGFAIEPTVIPAGQAVTFVAKNNSVYVRDDPSQNVLRAADPGPDGTYWPEMYGFFSDVMGYGDDSNWIQSMNQSPTGGTITIDDACMGMRASWRENNTDLYVGILDEYPLDSNNEHADKRFLSISHNGWGYGMFDIVDAGDIGFDMYSTTVNTTAGSSASANGNDLTPFNYQTLLVQSPLSGLNELLPGMSVIMNQPDQTGYSYTDKVHSFSQQNVRAPLFNAGLLSYGTSGDFKMRFYHHGPRKAMDTNTKENFNLGEALEMRNPPFAISQNSSSGTDSLVLFESPKSTPLSIGNLMHAHLTNVDIISPDVDGWRNNFQTPQMAPTYAIGNSFSSINIFDLDGTYADYTDGKYKHPQTGGQDGAHYDFSYRLNDLLWDRFFFSSIQPDEDLPVPFVLPNQRMVNRGGDDAVNANILKDPNTAATALAVEGGFNVNSTSVAAWESVLGAMRGVEHLGSQQANTDEHTYTRLTAPGVSGILEPDYSDRAEITTGFRALSDAQITDLAEAIVREVRIRRSYYGYPFSSLSEFINRSINTADINANDRERFAYCGALQHAIDQSGVNGAPGLDEDWGTTGGADGMWDSSYSFGNVPGGTGEYDSKALEVIKRRPYLEGIVGTIMQADILSKIGSQITTRSDTFKIRSYGDVVDPVSQNVTSEAYYEIVVQRVPDYVDSSSNNADDGSIDIDGNPLPLTSALNATNSQMGRRFEIVSMRWLTADEI